jgi:hypothetical protein
MSQLAESTISSFKSKHLSDVLIEGLIGRKSNHGIQEAADKLGSFRVDISKLRKAADFVNKRFSRSIVIGEFKFKIGEYEYPLRTDPQGVTINTMHAALSGDDKVRANLRITTEQAAGMLWGALLDWQTIFFGLESRKTILDVVNEVQNELSKQVVARSPGGEIALELYTLLEALKQPSTVSFRVALPNLKLLKDDGTIENEYDVVSIVLKNDKDVEIWVWGVTTEQDLTRKRTSDLAKIQRLKDFLGGRWATDVKVVTCYVHKERNDICCEIDGRQERRTITP